MPGNMKITLLGLGKSLIGLGAFFVSFGIYQLSSRTWNEDISFVPGDLQAPREKKSHQYLVDTPQCKIPDIDPFDSSIRKLLPLGSVYVCNKYPTLTYIQNSTLFINWTAVKEVIMEHGFGYCKYQVIFRPNIATDHNFFTYLPESKAFSSTVDVSGDFIRVRCYNELNDLIYTNFHHIFHKKPAVEKRCNSAFKRHTERNAVEETLSVAIVGVDSVSRLNFMRYMPKTRKYLLDNLHAVELNGYNKVADNTFVNIVPMTMGKFLEEIPWDETLSNVPFDEYDFIWKQFSKNGYRTLYAEDAPNIAIFDYLKAGFHKKPADYFNRHYSIALTKAESLWYNNNKCVIDRLETQDILDYTQRFLTVFKDDPHFAFTFVTGLTHDFVENSAAADRPYYNFLKSLHTSGSLNNTVLLLFSDHGMRFGRLRETYVGKLEERLPFMFLVFPQWFLKKYPNISRNLRMNSNRLTTPFDIYETLRGILYFKNRAETSTLDKRGMNLFNEIPSDRNCTSAGILPHWCTCAEQIIISAQDASVKLVANYILQRINYFLRNFKNICEYLLLDHVIHASKTLPSNKVLSFKRSLHDVIDRTVTYGERAKAYVDYQIQLKSYPGGALFEATVRFSEMENSYKLMGDISRINLYGQQSTCISQHTLKKYCYCRN